MEEIAQKIAEKMLTEIEQADTGNRGAIIRDLQTLVHTLRAVQESGGFAALCGVPEPAPIA